MTYGRVSYPDQVWPAGEWLTNWSITATVSWSPFQGFFTRGQEIAAHAELEQARVQLARARERAVYEAEEVALQLRAAQAVLNAARATAEQARRAYALAELRCDVAQGYFISRPVDLQALSVSFLGPARKPSESSTSS